MEQCPRCGRYMTFGMSYSCGTPQVFYTCSCGYDTRAEKIFATTSTSFIAEGAEVLSKWLTSSGQEKPVPVHTHP